MTNEKRITRWNYERNIVGVPDDGLVVFCKLEELFEFLGVNKAMPKDKFKQLVKTYTTYLMAEQYSTEASATVEDKINALNNDSVFNTGFIHRYGYDPSEVMNQGLLHIESRTGSMGKDGKWQKTSDTDVVYEPRYSEARYER